MKKLIIISLFLFGCNITNKDLAWICTCEQQDAVGSFVSANIKNANNMSDEEMEDVIRELRRTGTYVNCQQKYLEVNDWGFVYDPDSCEVVMNLR